MLPLAEGFYGLTEVHVALFISGVAAIYVIRRWRRNTVIKNTSTPTTPVTTPSHSALSVREVAMEVQALLADLEETARRLAAQLDNRYTRIEQLMAEADEKIKRLESLTAPASKNSLAPSSSRPLTEAPLQVSATSAQRALSRLRHERGAPPAEQDPAYQPIYSLADRGKSSREIAQELGRQPGEIELILALRQRA